MDKSVVVISGGTRGIGKAIACNFAKQGHSVAVVARNKDDLEALKKNIESRYGVSCFTFKADLSKKNEVNQFVGFINDLSVPIQVLVNNTGYFLPSKICDESEGQLEIMMNTNLYSAYYLTRGIMPALKSYAQNGHASHVFNISSVAGIQPYENGGAYSISKYAMTGFSANLREEVRADNVRVTTVMPGAVLTDAWDGYNGREDRLMSADDIGQAVWSAFALSSRTMVEDLVLRPQLGDL